MGRLLNGLFNIAERFCPNVMGILRAPFRDVVMSKRAVNTRCNDLPRLGIHADRCGKNSCREPLTVDKETVRRSLIASMVQTLPALASSFYALLIKTALIPSGIPMS